jgi:hypothetical protein
LQAVKSCDLWEKGVPTRARPKRSIQAPKRIQRQKQTSKPATNKNDEIPAHILEVVKNIDIGEIGRLHQVDDLWKGFAIKDMERMMAADLTPKTVSQLQQTYGNRTVRKLLTLAAAPSSPISKSKKRKVRSIIAYIGMNPHARKEIKALKRKARDKVLAPSDMPGLEKKLKTEKAIDNFIRDFLGVTKASDPVRHLTLRKTLALVKHDVRELLAQLMIMFNAAEKGQYKLERMVISGHSDGVAVWGEASKGRNPGTIILFRDFTNLVKSFPKAAAQVQDIMFSACFSVTAVNLCLKMFPNLQSVWSYSQFSPSIKQGSARHIQSWERSTRGAKRPTKASKRGSAAIWIRGKGYVTGDPAKTPLVALEGQAARLSGMAREMRLGKAPLDKGTLRIFYIFIQRIISHPQANENTKKFYCIERDQILRLRYWELVRQKFAIEYKDQIVGAYTEVGWAKQIPAYNSFSRADLYAEKNRMLRRVREYKKRKQPTTFSMAFLKGPFFQGLVLLKPKYIPRGWL